MRCLPDGSWNPAVHEVDSQLECEDEAVKAGHAYYQFRKECLTIWGTGCPQSDDTPFLCATVATCDSPLVAKNLWQIFTSTCDASTAPANGAVGDCTDTLASGSTCQPTCDDGHTVSGSSSCTTGSLTAATCDACDASTPPTHGGVGDCTVALASGSACQPTCDGGYTVSGSSSCITGSLTAATCYASPCDASTPPTNGAVGDCTDALASGSTCQPTCDSGYTVSGSSSCNLGSLTAATCEGNPCDASTPPTNGAVGDCTDALASGSACQPTCDGGYTVSGSSSCNLGSLTAATCEANPCDASTPPTNGAVGDCTDALASGSACQPTCDSGYTVSGSSSCTTGSLTDATCEGNPCDASTPPTNGAVGECTDALASGSACQPTCDDGYTVSGSSSCTAGSLTAATCEANPCDASTPPTNGAVGDCTDALASGTACQPTCDDGYTVSCSSSCTAGSLTAATCEAPVLLYAGLKCKPQAYVTSEDRTCADSVCTVLECAAYIKTRNDCSQAYFNYGTGLNQAGGCGCVTDVDVDCTDSANQGSPDNGRDRDIYGIPAGDCNSRLYEVKPGPLGSASSVRLAGVSMVSVAAIAALMAFRMTRVRTPVDVGTHGDDQEAEGSDGDRLHLLAGAI